MEPIEPRTQSSSLGQYGRFSNTSFLGGQRLRQAVIHRPVEMIGNLGDLTGRDERADRGETAIAASEVGTQPQVAKQDVGGLLDDARKHRAELLLDTRRSLRFGGFVDQQRRREDGGELVAPDLARGEDVL